MTEISTYYVDYLQEPLIRGSWQDTKGNIGNDYILGWHLKNIDQECFIIVAYEDIVIEPLKSSLKFFRECDLCFYSA